MLAPAGVPLQPFDEASKPADKVFRLLRVTETMPVQGLSPGNYLVGDDGNVSYKIDRNIPPGLRAPLNELGASETIPSSQDLPDKNTYRVWQRPDTGEGSAQRYLVSEDGTPAYLVDPGINGKFKTRPNGSTVRSSTLPKRL